MAKKKNTRREWNYKRKPLSTSSNFFAHPKRSFAGPLARSLRLKKETIKRANNKTIPMRYLFILIG